jgi:hypothetical protein
VTRGTEEELGETKSKVGTEKKKKKREKGEAGKVGKWRVGDGRL